MVKNMNLNIKEIIEIAGGIMLPLNELIHTPFITPLVYILCKKNVNIYILMEI